MYKNIYIQFILFFFFLISVNSINAQDSTKIICKGGLIYRNSSNRIEDEKYGYNFVKYNDEYIDCLVPCPSPFFTIDNWEMFLNLGRSMGTISFICGLFVLITYSPLVNKKHNRHSIGILCMSFGVCIAMCTDFFYFGYSFKSKSLCNGPGQYLTSHDVTCLSSGILLEFGAVFGLLWWTILSFDLLSNIRAKRSRDIKSYNKIFVISTFSISILFAFIPVANDQYSMSYIGLGCWLGNAAHQLGLFWIPLSICLIISVVFIILILKEIYQIVKQSNQKSSIKGNIRPLLCILVMCFAFFYMMFYYLAVAADKSHYEQVLNDYIKCLIENDDISNCSAAKMSVAANFIFLVCVRLLGIGAFLFYGINNKVKKIWLESYWFNNSFVNKSFKSSSSSSSSFSGNNSNNSKNNSNNYNSSNNTSSDSNNNNSSAIEMTLKDDTTEEISV